MTMLHATAMVLMIGTAIIAFLCCVVALVRSGGRAVPWQGCQSAAIMAIGMPLLCAGGQDAGTALLVAAVSIVSAMLGVVGMRGRALAAGCFHRAVGCVAMAVCAVSLPAGGSVPPGVAAGAPGHGGHAAAVPWSFVAAGAVLLLLVGRGAVRRRRPHVLAVGVQRMLRAEEAAMAVSLGLMGVLAAAGGMAG